MTLQVNLWESPVWDMESSELLCSPPCMNAKSEVLAKTSTSEVLDLSSDSRVPTKEHLKAIKVFPQAKKTKANKGLVHARRMVGRLQKGKTESWSPVKISGSLLGPSLPKVGEVVEKWRALHMENIKIIKQEVHSGEDIKTHTFVLIWKVSWGNVQEWGWFFVWRAKGIFFNW